MTTFGTYLRGLLKQRDWDQSRLALETGLPASTISNLITKTPKKGPEIETLAKVAAALEVDLGDLMEQAGYPVRRSSSAEVRQRRLTRILDAASWVPALVEKVAELPENDQDTAISFVEHLLARHRSQKG